MSLHRLRTNAILAGFLIAVFAPTADAGPAQDGVAFYNSAHYKEALASFEKAWPQIQSDPNLLYYYAITAQRLGDRTKSEHIYKQIVAKFPDSLAASHSRQALGLPPVKAKPQASSAAPQDGPALPYNCPVPCFPGAEIIEATDKPANVWEWKEIKLQAIAAPEKVLEFYEAEMAHHTNWALDEKTPVEKQPRKFKDGKQVFGFVDFKNNVTSEEYKNVSISVDSKDAVATPNTVTDIEIHLWVKHRR